MEYWRRENARQKKAQSKSADQATPEQITDNVEQFPWRPLSENVAEGQFQALHSMMVTPAGGSAEIMKIPEHLREAIRWAEDEKLKRGMN